MCRVRKEVQRAPKRVVQSVKIVNKKDENLFSFKCGLEIKYFFFLEQIIRPGQYSVCTSVTSDGDGHEILSFEAPSCKIRPVWLQFDQHS